MSAFRFPDPMSDSAQSLSPPHDVEENNEPIFETEESPPREEEDKGHERDWSCVESDREVDASLISSVDGMSTISLPTSQPSTIQTNNLHIPMREEEELEQGDDTSISGSSQWSNVSHLTKNKRDAVVDDTVSPKLSDATTSNALNTPKSEAQVIVTSPQTRASISGSIEAQRLNFSLDDIRLASSNPSGFQHDGGLRLHNVDGEGEDKKESACAVEAERQLMNWVIEQRAGKTMGLGDSQQSCASLLISLTSRDLTEDDIAPDDSASQISSNIVPKLIWGPKVSSDTVVKPPPTTNREGQVDATRVPLPPSLSSEDTFADSEIRRSGTTSPESGVTQPLIDNQSSPASSTERQQFLKRFKRQRALELTRAGENALDAEPSVSSVVQSAQDKDALESSEPADKSVVHQSKLGAQEDASVAEHAQSAVGQIIVDSTPSRLTNMGGAIQAGADEHASAIASVTSFDNSSVTRSPVTAPPSSTPVRSSGSEVVRSPLRSPSSSQGSASSEAQLSDTTLVTCLETVDDRTDLGPAPSLPRFDLFDCGPNSEEAPATPSRSNARATPSQPPSSPSPPSTPPLHTRVQARVGARIRRDGERQRQQIGCQEYFFFCIAITIACSGAYTFNRTMPSSDVGSSGNVGNALPFETLNGGFMYDQQSSTFQVEVTNVESTASRVHEDNPDQSSDAEILASQTGTERDATPQFTMYFSTATAEFESTSVHFFPASPSLPTAASDSRWSNIVDQVIRKQVDRVITKPVDSLTSSLWLMLVPYPISMYKKFKEYVEWVVMRIWAIGDGLRGGSDVVVDKEVERGTASEWIGMLVMVVLAWMSWSSFQSARSQSYTATTTMPIDKLRALLIDVLNERQSALATALILYPKDPIVKSLCTGVDHLPGVELGLRNEIRTRSETGIQRGCLAYVLSRLGQPHASQLTWQKFKAEMVDCRGGDSEEEARLEVLDLVMRNQQQGDCLLTRVVKDEDGVRGEVRVIGHGGSGKSVRSKSVVRFEECDSEKKSELNQGARRSTSLGAASATSTEQAESGATTVRRASSLGKSATTTIEAMSPGVRDTSRPAAMPVRTTPTRQSKTVALERLKEQLAGH